MPTAMHREKRRRCSFSDDEEQILSSKNGRSDRRKVFRSRSRSNPSRRREKPRRERFYRGSSGTRTKRRSDDRKIRLKQLYEYRMVGVPLFFFVYPYLRKLKMACAGDVTLQNIKSKISSANDDFMSIFSYMLQFMFSDHHICSRVSSSYN